MRKSICSFIDKSELTVHHIVKHPLSRSDKLVVQIVKLLRIIRCTFWLLGRAVHEGFVDIAECSERIFFRVQLTHSGPPDQSDPWPGLCYEIAIQSMTLEYRIFLVFAGKKCIGTSKQSTNGRILQVNRCSDRKIC